MEFFSPATDSQLIESKVFVSDVGGVEVSLELNPHPGSLHKLLHFGIAVVVRESWSVGGHDSEGDAAFGVRCWDAVSAKATGFRGLCLGWKWGGSPVPLGRFLC